MPEISTLSNGLRVVTHSMPSMASASIGVWVGVGSRYESDPIAGVSHFLEHLLFKGTKVRSAKQISEAIEGVGGVLNAFTSEEHTCYLVRVPADKAERGVEVLSDMLLHSVLDPKEIKREKGVIVEEMNMSKDNPSDFVQELLSEILWPKQPLGRLIIGSEETIRGMTRRQILDYKTRHYVAKNLVLAAAGNVQHARLVEAAKRWFAALPRGEAPGYAKATESVPGPRVGLLRRKTEQAHLALAFPGVSRYHPDRWALRVLAVILGGNMSSRLFQEVREKRGLAYDVSCSVHHYDDVGTVAVYAGTEASKAQSCLQTISAVLRKMKSAGPTADELTRAKEYSIGRFALSLERTTDYMLWMGEHLICRNEIPCVQEVLDGFADVASQDVVRVAKEFLVPNRARLQAIGQGLSEKSLLGQIL